MLKALWKGLGQFIALAVLGVGFVVLIQWEVGHLRRTSIPHIHGVFQFSAQVQYPPPQKDKTPVEVRLALDEVDHSVVTGKPTGKDHDYIITWNTKTTSNGIHKMIILAYYGKALIGEESHTVFVDN
jgi:hypothetical protein